ncbi:hypothetical protein ERC79_10285 [Rhodococcus sp. ABRD24]|uniref:hypothetical protein n=1 Tax=Rhodococcus sp. ABRD24 TaxID=2507582 RepID=UPI00103C615C|nr:hypothetical protein [Rhodococcus sp. ABRD24]QBJ96314.1 hypothetical protein ERC79_10285 [Rhodococcus sp. ABRD24]
MSSSRTSIAVAALAGTAWLAFAPSAAAATTYQVTAIPPIGTVFANTITTIAVVVSPTPAGADGTSPVVMVITEPGGDSSTVTVPLTLGGATVATRVHEAGRYSAVFTFAPPVGDPASATMQFDVSPSPFGTASAS